MRKLYRDTRELLRGPKRWLSNAKGLRALGRGPGLAAGLFGSDLPSSGIVNDGVGASLARELHGNSRPVLMYLPWIDAHAGPIIAALSDARCGFDLRPFRLFSGMNERAARGVVTRYARAYPDRYRRILLRELLPLRDRLAAFVLTFDWHPATRVLSRACRELGIRRLLIPHEGVFMDADRYYFDAASGVAIPDAEHVLCWGQQQFDIFAQRGYPAERMSIVGAPKFDAHRAYRAPVDRSTFYRFWGLDPARRTILCAVQPLDNQANERVARRAQARAVLCLIEHAQASGHNLIVRVPPAGGDCLSRGLCARIERAPDVVLDDGSSSIFTALDMLHHTDCTVAINSTMLLEARLMGRPAIAARFFDYALFWEPLGIPVASDGVGLREQVERALHEPVPPLSATAAAWVDTSLAKDATAGQAAREVRRCVERLLVDPPTFYDPVAGWMRGDYVPVGTVGFPHLKRHQAQHAHVRALLGTTRVRAVETLRDAYACDVIAQWGAEPTAHKRRVRALAGRVGRPLVYVEDGFIRSFDIGLSGEPGLSLMLDDLGAYYDATGPTRIERLLESDVRLTEAQQARARAAIEAIVEGRVSKYNHAPDTPVSFGTSQRRKVAVLDQRRGDASVRYGLADDAQFVAMLERAVADHPDKDVLVKRHPDALRGGRESYFADADRLRAHSNVLLVDADCNPYRFLELVDEVYTVSSGMGFEALMAGKQVHCFGLPFYAGWGLTHDRIQCSRRTRTRTLLDVFHLAYVQLSRYYRPDLGRCCSLEELIAFIIEKKHERDGTKSG